MLILIFAASCTTQVAPIEEFKDEANEVTPIKGIDALSDCLLDNTEKECLIELAVQNHDLGYCEKFSSFDYYGISDCYTKAAKQIKDADVCSKISSERQNKLTTDELQAMCYFNIAYTTGDLTVCESIQDTELKENCKNQVMIDFSSCEAAEETVFVAFGSTVYNIIGIENEKCIMEFGGEVEDPSWDGSMSYRCMVPKSLGTQIFFKTNYGVDFSGIIEYCTEII